MCCSTLENAIQKLRLFLDFRIGFRPKRERSGKMKITQISEYSLPAEGGLPPLQAMIYEELMRRPD
jgi:hypothetical protein